MWSSVPPLSERAMVNGTLESARRGAVTPGDTRPWDRRLQWPTGPCASVLCAAPNCHPPLALLPRVMPLLQVCQDSPFPVKKWSNSAFKALSFWLKITSHRVENTHFLFYLLKFLCAKQAAKWPTFCLHNSLWGFCLHNLAPVEPPYGISDSITRPVRIPLFV